MYSSLVSSLILFVSLGTALFHDLNEFINLKSTSELDSLLKHDTIWNRKDRGYKERIAMRELNPINSNDDVPSDNNNLFNNIAGGLIEFTKDQNRDWFNSFHDYTETINWYKQLEKKYPNLITINDMGTSYEGRKMIAVHITSPTRNLKKRVWFESLMHAREWITSSTVQYLVNHLVTNQAETRIQNLLRKLELIVVPIVNPDGYQYTWTTDRLWRKNRREVLGGIGVDLNRNFPANWQKLRGTSANPNSEIYQGPSPASEPETKNIVNYFTRHLPIVGAIDFHSYSQLILRPYGTTFEDSPDEAKLSSLAQAMANIIEGVRGKRYLSKKTIQLYPASGTASDWFYSAGRHTYAYTIELSPTAIVPSVGFLLPPSQILKVGEDILPAALHFMETAADNPL